MQNNNKSLRYFCKIISKYLKRFVQKHGDVLYSNGDIEPVHQMRVASRRLRAASNVFKSILPKQKNKLWKKEINKIGRVLGRARELDIHIRFLQVKKRKLESNFHIANIDLIIKYLERKRRKAQKHIEAALIGFEIKKNFPGLKICLRKISSGAHSHLADKFHSRKSKIVKKRLDKLLQFVWYVHKPRKVDELHQMRIAAKNLRYTLEILMPWYGARVTKYIQASRDIQDVLGDMHEQDTLIEVLSGFLKKRNKDFDNTVVYLINESTILRNDYYKNFLQLWSHLQEKRIWVRLREEIQG